MSIRSRRRNKEQAAKCFYFNGNVLGEAPTQQRAVVTSPNDLPNRILLGDVHSAPAASLYTIAKIPLLIYALQSIESQFGTLLSI